MTADRAATERLVEAMAETMTEVGGPAVWHDHEARAAWVDYYQRYALALLAGPVGEALAAEAARAEAAERSRDMIREAGRVAEAERDAFRAALTDFAQHGIRTDCNPTMSVEGAPIGWWYEYLHSADQRVRDRARRALAGPTEDGEGER